MTLATLSTKTMLTNLPAISITSPTPPRPYTTNDVNMTPTPASISQPVSSTPRTPPTTTTPSTATTSHASYRLLYRGALSLPDSHMLLDGLTFAARLDSPSKHSNSAATFHLLENPLALALESMRGRPSLRFIESVGMGDVYVDESGGVEMDIHPHAMLTRVYFENMFCISPFPTASTSKSIPSAPPSPAMKSNIGIKVALGDSDGPETTHIIIFARRLLSSASTNTIQLTVGRIMAAPPTVPVRLPRPDDPIPRKPPIIFGRDLKRSTSGSFPVGRELKRAASGSLTVPGPETAKKLKKSAAGVGVAADLGSGVRFGTTEDGKLFKVPELPVKPGRAKGKGKEEAEDVFGDVAEVAKAESKAKGKKAGNAEDGMKDVEDMETVNKNLIKKAAIKYLSLTKDPTSSRMIDKTHPEFKEMWGYVYRGVGFALRAYLKTRPIDPNAVDRLTGMHVKMYVNGVGAEDTVGSENIDAEMNFVKLPNIF